MTDPTFSLLSLESDIPRPRVLATGTLERCLSELQEVVLNDHVSCNRSRLTITVSHPGEPPTAIVEVVRIFTTGER